MISEWSAEPLLPSDIALWFELADDFTAAGEQDTAAQVLRLLLERYPSNTEARERLSALEGNP